MKEQDKDHLKGFVHSHREEFDTETPPAMDFGNLMPSKEEEKTPKMVPITWLYRIAAVFVALLAVGAFWVLNSNTTETETTVAVEEVEQAPTEFNLGELSPEMAELEDYYTHELSVKQQALEEMGHGDAIAEELAFLDEEFATLKTELGENVDNHLIVNEMVKNYKLKLDLLQSVLNDLQENYDDKNLTNLEDDENYTIYY
jgi:hypothetical protein